MKRLTAILFLCLFLITNSGMAMAIHWCGGKLTSVDFFHNDDHPCPCGKKAMKSGCCKNTTTTFKACDELAKTSAFLYKASISSFNFGEPQYFETFLSSQFLYSASYFYHPPPFKPKVPIYLMDRVILV